MQVFIPVWQHTDFQRFNQIFNILNAGQHGWHYDQGARFRRNTF